MTHTHSPFSSQVGSVHREAEARLGYIYTTMMSYWRRVRFPLKTAPAVIRSWYSCTILRRTVYYSSSNAGSEADSNETRREVPLDAEWAELAKKQLKGGDPSQKLIWRTPEVRCQPVIMREGPTTFFHSRLDFCSHGSSTGVHTVPMNEITHKHLLKSCKLYV